MDEPEDEIRSRPRRRRKGSGCGGSLFKNLLFLAAFVYTCRQGIWLLRTPEPVGRSERDLASAFGGFLGLVTTFWLGAVLCVSLLRYRMGGTFAGSRHKGLSFVLRFVLAFGLCLGGGMAVFLGSTVGQSDRASAYSWRGGVDPVRALQNTLLRGVGVVLLLGGAVALVAAFGRKRLTRRERMKVLLDGEEA